jgi:hypothetical protein
MRVLLRPFLEGVEKPWVRYTLKKKVWKKGDWCEVFIEPLGGVWRSMENLWDILDLWQG